jgi:hypothetical protein
MYCLAAAKGEPLKLVLPEPDNTTDIEDCIKRAKANEKDFTKININNIREVKADVLQDLLHALKENTFVEILEMSNVGMTDAVGCVCSMLTSIRARNDMHIISNVSGTSRNDSSK